MYAKVQGCIDRIKIDETLIQLTNDFKILFNSKNNYPKLLIKINRYLTIFNEEKLQKIYEVVKYFAHKTNRKNYPNHHFASKYNNIGKNKSSSPNSEDFKEMENGKNIDDQYLQNSLNYKSLKSKNINDKNYIHKNNTCDLNKGESFANTELAIKIEESFNLKENQHIPIFNNISKTYPHKINYPFNSNIETDSSHMLNIKCIKRDLINNSINSTDKRQDSNLNVNKDVEKIKSFLNYNLKENNILDRQNSCHEKIINVDIDKNNDLKTTIETNFSNYCQKETTSDNKIISIDNFREEAIIKSETKNRTPIYNIESDKDNHKLTNNLDKNVDNTKGK